MRSLEDSPWGRGGTEPSILCLKDSGPRSVPALRPESSPFGRNRPAVPGTGSPSAPVLLRSSAGSPLSSGRASFQRVWEPWGRVHGARELQPQWWRPGYRIRTLGFCPVSGAGRPVDFLAFGRQRVPQKRPATGSKQQSVVCAQGTASTCVVGFLCLSSHYLLSSTSSSHTSCLQSG